MNTADLNTMIEHLNHDIAKLENYFSFTSLTSTPFTVAFCSEDGEPQSALQILNSETGECNFLSNTVTIQYSKPRADRVAASFNNPRIQAISIYSFNTIQLKRLKKAREMLAKNTENA